MLHIHLLPARLSCMRSLNPMNLKQQYGVVTAACDICRPCSDGTELKLDAQPDFNPGWSDGTLRSTNGFNNISVYATSAVESLFGAGGQEGEQTETCNGCKW
jgi:hypothetical protein